MIDLMPTCVEAGGATYPKGFDGKPILPMEGRSLLPAIDDNPIERDALFWEHEGNAAVRVGNWKLVRFGRKGPWELYNMTTDRTELHDLSSSEPQRAKELLARWDAWAQRAHAEPDPSGKKGNAKGKKNANGDE